MQLQTKETPAAKGTRICTGTTEKLIACIGTHSFQHCHQRQTQPHHRRAYNMHARMRTSASGIIEASGVVGRRHEYMSTRGGGGRGGVGWGAREWARVHRRLRGLGSHAYIEHIRYNVLLIALQALTCGAVVELPVHYTTLDHIEERVVPYAGVDDLIKGDTLRDIS